MSSRDNTEQQQNPSNQNTEQPATESDKQPQRSTNESFLDSLSSNNMSNFANAEDADDDSPVNDMQADDEDELQQRIRIARALGFDISQMQAQDDSDDDNIPSDDDDSPVVVQQPKRSASPPFRMGGFGGFGGGFGRFYMQESSSDEEEEPKTIDEKRAKYKCGNKYTTLASIKTWEEMAADKKLKNGKKNKRKFAPNAEINKKVSMWTGDSTTLEIDAIVNAANNSLLGGGGIDGAIHSAAGRGLYKECRTLNGCPTGMTKITKGYRLPAKHVLHTVGPTSEDSEALEGCYKTCLQLVDKHNIKTVAFCCVSTGIFGYPLRPATKIALNTARTWLETNDNYKKVDRIIFVVYLDRERACYEKYFSRYFPLPLTPEEQDKEAQEKDAPPSDSDDEDTPRPMFYSNWRFPTTSSMGMGIGSSNNAARSTTSTLTTNNNYGSSSSSTSSSMGGGSLSIPSSAFRSAAAVLEERKKQQEANAQNNPKNN